MALITKVKAGSVSSLSDARYFSGMGVDWLGFDLNPASAHYVSPALYQSIAGWVSGPKRVIELLKDFSKADLTELISQYAPDAIETTLDQLDAIQSQTNLPIIARIDLDKEPALSSSLITNPFEYILVSSENPLAHRSRLEELSRIAPILLNINADTNNVKELLADLPLAGISLQGSIEIKVGEKDYPFADLLESLDEDVN